MKETGKQRRKRERKLARAASKQKKREPRDKKQGWLEWWMSIPERLENVPLWIRAFIGFFVIAFVLGWFLGGLNRTNKIYDWQ